ncbi:MAG: hypothetical protein DWQ01_22425 [Planctomycetota bacterium]|nr:MAG: hypothetical protein DWQ01_22425 [Planctomycetota bacterium]
MKPIFILGLLVFAAPLAIAQRIGGEWDLKHHIFGEKELGFFGDAVAGPGDLDGDGFADFVVGAPYEFFEQGRVYAYSGKTGDLLWDWTEGAVGHKIGSSIAGAGDVNGDGRPDVIVGIPQVNKVAVLLHNGTLWWIKENPIGNHGGSVAGIGDINFDGFEDIIVGANRATSGGNLEAGVAIVYSGMDGSLMFQFDGLSGGDRLGTSVAGAGDVNADGIPDIMISAPWDDRGPFDDVGTVYIISGGNGSIIYELSGPQVEDEFFGFAISEAGDLNLDGFGDIMATTAGSDAYHLGSVLVFSGASGGILFRVDGGPIDHIGSAIDSTEDLDFDGLKDILISSEVYPPRLGRVEVRSGADGTLLDTVFGQVEDVGFGQSLSSIGEIEGNSLEAFIVGMKAKNNGNIDSAGAVQVFSPNPFIFADATELSASSGVPVQVLMSFPESEANSKYALLLSGAGTGPTTIAGLEVPLGQSLLLSQMLTGWAPFNLHGAFGTLDANAQATATLDSDPTLAGLVGTTFYMAAVTYDSTPALAGRRTSIAWPIRITL